MVGYARTWWGQVGIGREYGNNDIKKNGVKGI
jgi:hypothetical protein